MRNHNFGFWLLIVLAVLLFGFGSWFALTPTVNQIKHQEQAASEVAAFFQEKEAAFTELLAAMQAYNDQIYADHQAGLADPWAYSAAVLDLSDYGLTSDAPVGVLTIPKMDFEEPIYLGATMEHLARGAAQLSISSMPIGGVNTNCVLAGHRGWQGALHFRHIELLEVGDEIQLTNLWEVLKYRVVEIKIIQPWQAEELLIQEGRDLLTLVTCHPYGSGGKYRYIVCCERKE